VTGVAHPGQFFRLNLQTPRRLLDERTGATRTRALHQNLFALRVGTAVEEDRLHVFAADFADEADVWMQFFHGGGNGDDFLDDFPAEERRDPAGSGSGEEHAVAFARQPMAGFERGQEFENLFRLFSVMPLVGLREDLAR
jgi:hypothetical protein